MTLHLSHLRNCKSGLTAKGGQRQFVQHSYTDRSKDHVENLTESDENTLRLYREDSIGGTFPIKLQVVLRVIEKLGQEHIISWLPHGRSFMIHKPREFEDEVMGKFFKQTKLTSFQRQLNLYDFQRITHGRDAGSYYHELFLRGRPLLAKRMVRRKVKGTKIRASSSPDDEPNFYTMPFMTSGGETLSNNSAAVRGMMMDQESMLGSMATNMQSRSSLLGLQGPSVADTIGQLPAALSGAYDQSILQRNSFSSSSPLHSLSSPRNQQSAIYSDLMQAYGAVGDNRLPLSQTYAGSIDNLNYSNALNASVLQQDYLNQSLSSPYDQLAAAEMRYKSDLALLNREASLLEMARYSNLPLGRDSRLAQLSDLALAEETFNSQLLQQYQLQQHQQKSLMMDLHSTSPHK
jgi:hypothetical protein